MIQAPNLQYINAQQPVQTGYQPQGANNVQYTQTPGVIYNYPTSSCWGQSATGKPQYNGVNIEIINPQGQGVIPQAGYMPAQYYVPTQAPAYQQPVMPQIPQAPIAPQPAIQQEVPAPQITQAYDMAAPANATPTEAAPAGATPVVEQPAAPDASQTPESFAAKLKSDDLNAQKLAIEEVAEAVKNNETLGPVLLDTQIFDSLADIINKDTSKLEGPSPEVIELRQKPQEELSEEDKAKTTTPSPLEAAEINKQYALYTIAFMQERLNSELQKRNNQTLAFGELPCIDLVIETAKSNPNPKLRVGALAALSHIQKPEYKNELKTIFELAQSDEDAQVQESAKTALDVLNNI